MVTIYAVSADADIIGYETVTEFQAIANDQASALNQYDPSAPGPTTDAFLYTGPFDSDVNVEGSGFTYNTSGMLVGGTITTINGQVYGPPDHSNYAFFRPYQVEYSGLALSVAQADALAQVSDPASVLLADGATIFSVGSSVVTGGPGDDTFVLQGNPYYQTDVYGGGGADTAELQSNFLSDAVITQNDPTDPSYSNTGTETVSTADLVANLNSVAKIQFIDGSVYEDSATPGGQAALMWLGVFGRPEDAINLGGYAAVAEQSGTAQAAAQMLATPEGSADVAGLTTTQLVTRLYENILHRAPEPSGLAGWVNAIDTGYVDRAQALAQFVLSPEAQTANAQLFDTGSLDPSTANASGVLFGANPNGVEVLRAYEVLLGRPVEASSLISDTNNLDNGISLQDLYTSIQNSAEFALDSYNPYNITANTSYAAVYSIAHSEQVTDLLPISSTGGIGHLAG